MTLKALDNFRPLILTLQFSPGFRRRHHQLEKHETSGVLRPRVSCGFCDASPVANTLSIRFVTGMKIGGAFSSAGILMVPTFDATILDRGSGSTKCGQADLIR